MKEIKTDGLIPLANEIKTKEQPLSEVERNKIELLKKEIIHLLIAEKYQEEVLFDIERRAEGILDEDILTYLSDLYLNRGNALGNLAKAKEGKEAEELYRQSFEKYQKAIEINSDNDEAFNDWGYGLETLAKTKKGQEAEALFLQSFEKYQKAIEINPNHSEAFNNWGNSLGNLAKTKKGKEAKALFYQSFEKYEKATEINPDNDEAFNNRAVALGFLVKIKKKKRSG